MRSNIARTESAGGGPGPAALFRRSFPPRGGATAARALSSPFLVAALQRREEVHERDFLVLGKSAEGGHRGGRILERAADRALLELVADVGEVRTGAAVAVLADHVAREATGLGRDELALLQVGRH